MAGKSKPGSECHCPDGTETHAGGIGAFATITMDNSFDGKAAVKDRKFYARRMKACVFDGYYNGTVQYVCRN